MYDYKRINTFLQQHTGKLDPTKENSAHIFTIHFEFATYRIFIIINGDYELDLSQGNFSELLGYNKRILTRSSFGDKVPKYHKRC